MAAGLAVALAACSGTTRSDDPSAPSLAPSAPALVPELPNVSDEDRDGDRIDDALASTRATRI